SDPEGSDEKRRAWAGVSYCLVMSNVESHYYRLLTFHSSLFPTLFVGFLRRLELFAPWLGRAWAGFDRPGQVDHGPLAGNRLDGSFVDDFLAVLSPLALDLVLVGLAGSEIVRGESSHSAGARDFFPSPELHSPLPRGQPSRGLQRPTGASPRTRDAQGENNLTPLLYGKRSPIARIIPILPSGKGLGQIFLSSIFHLPSSILDPP